ncbi:MAG: precorrin-2 C(20)-methyltransferase [Alphaproteobacteria bacterium]|nr:precorrin-2 C(20)-methyltransferase [Alphaproteobacteria bacterium]
MPKAVLYGIGVGPGDPELLTLKAARLLREVPVIAYPAPMEGPGLARSIAGDLVPSGRIEIALRMEMSLERSSANAAYDSGAVDIAKHLDAGNDVAFLCEGDPLLFGSFIYLMERLGESHEIQVVPGVASPMASASAALFPLATQEEAVLLVPASRSEEDLLRLIGACETACIFKVGRHLAKIRRVLVQLGRLDRARYVERASHADQRVLSLDEAIDKGGIYFAMVLVGS